jgi:Tfp pilus assembly protein PilV
MRRPARGMTLIELMISFAILVFGLVSIFAMINAALRSHKRAMNETDAAIVAESVLADLRSSFQRGQVPRSDGKAFFEPVDGFDGYSVNRTIVSLEPKRREVAALGGDREFFVRVEVRWSNEGDNKSIYVDSIMFANEEKRIEQKMRGN